MMLVKSNVSVILPQWVLVTQHDVHDARCLICASHALVSWGLNCQVGSRVLLGNPAVSGYHNCRLVSWGLNYQVGSRVLLGNPAVSGYHNCRLDSLAALW